MSSLLNLSSPGSLALHNPGEEISHHVQRLASETDSSCVDDMPNAFYVSSLPAARAPTLPETAPTNITAIELKVNNPGPDARHNHCLLLTTRAAPPERP